MFLYMQDNVPQRSGKCCATVRGIFLCGEDFDSEDGFIDFSKLTLSIGARELEKVPSQKYLQCTVCNPFILLDICLSQEIQFVSLT